MRPLRCLSGQATRCRRRERGAAALLVVVLLLFAITLALAFANRNLIFEQRSATNQVRALQAFEAAEAGLDWLIAGLNDRRRLGDDCRPDAAGSSLRERLLRFDAATRLQQPRSWPDAGVDRPRVAACVRGDDGWTCSCPTSGWPALPAPASDVDRPAFVVRLAATARTGMVRATATGCTSVGGACRPGSASSTDAAVTVESLLALVPGLSAAPVAPLTVKGGLDSAAALGLHNPDAASGGAALHAGGTLNAPTARLTTAAGGSVAAAVLDRDVPMSELTDDAFFGRLSILDKAAWRNQPAVQRIVCEGSCGPSLLAAIASGVNRLIWIDGDLTLAGPLALGSREQPLMLVASGAVQLSRAVTIHGLVYGHSLNWNDTGGGSAQVHGALVGESGYHGNGAPDLVYDRAVLDALIADSGSFARVPGSWKDF